MGELSNYIAHSVAGCVAGAAQSSGGCAAGAIGAVVGEASAIAYNGDRNVLVDGLKPDTVEFAEMMGGIAAAAAGQDPNIGAQAAGNAAANNLSSAVARGVTACMEFSICRNGVLTAAMATAVSAEIERTRAANPGMSERAVDALAVAAVLAQATVNGIQTAYSWFTATPTPAVNPAAGGYGAGDNPSPGGSTVLPTPAQAAREFGTPPLNSAQDLQGWLGNVLEGVPADQAQAWARDFIRTLPVSQQQTLGDFIMLAVSNNATGATANSEAAQPVGVSGSPMAVPRGTNGATTINGVDYSAHAIDQMQGRGIPPSAVQNTINVGVVYPTGPGTSGYYDPINNIRVIVNSTTGRVVTVIPGAP